MSLEFEHPSGDRTIRSADAKANDWILAIKELRAKFDVSIYEAERLLLNDPDWREWCRRRVALDQKCYKNALAHIRHNGEAALFALDGREMIFREGDD